MSSGYIWCRCRDCTEQVVSNDDSDPDFCEECEEAGCEDNSECQKEEECENREWIESLTF